MWSGKTPNVPSFICPSDPTLGNCTHCTQLSYAPNEAVIRTGSNPQKYPASITDGTSNTILYCEREFYCWTPSNSGVGFGWWNELRTPDHEYLNDVDSANVPQGAACYPQFSPPFGQCDVTLPSSGHTGVILAGLCDGSVRTVGQGVSPKSWGAALSPNGGDILGADW
jgi:hypothetical protein